MPSRVLAILQNSRTFPLRELGRSLALIALLFNFSITSGQDGTVIAFALLRTKIVVGLGRDKAEAICRQKKVSHS